MRKGLSRTEKERTMRKKERERERERERESNKLVKLIKTEKEMKSSKKREKVNKKKIVQAKVQNSKVPYGMKAFYEFLNEVFNGQVSTTILT